MVVCFCLFGPACWVLQLCTKAGLLARSAPRLVSAMYGILFQKELRGVSLSTPLEKGPRGATLFVSPHCQCFWRTPGASGHGVMMVRNSPLTLPLWASNKKVTFKDHHLRKQIDVAIRCFLAELCLSGMQGLVWEPCSANPVSCQKVYLPG
jgi:hypothetical protein